MDIREEFTVARPIGEVWTLFLDVPEVARCLPGADVTEDHGDGKYSGTLLAKLGPISSSFEGKATVVADEVEAPVAVKGSWDVTFPLLTGEGKEVRLSPG